MYENGIHAECAKMDLPRRKLRVLALHSFRTSGTIFREQVGFYEIIFIIIFNCNINI